MDARFIIASLSCLALSAFQSLYIAPRLLLLPSDYASETKFNATSRARDSATAPWRESTLVARRVDQMLVSSGTHGILQGDTHWTNADGVVEFETSAIYGVDRFTRENLPGYGDSARTGAFMFPLHTEAKHYRYWDPQFIGRCDAMFRNATQVDGVNVLAFSFTASKLDETDGYAYLPDVPERFRVHTDATGSLWIEPTSGIMVDYTEEGVSYLVDTSGKRIANVHEWRARYTPQTRQERLQQARTQRRRIALLERWTPAALLGAALLVLVVGLRRKRAHRLAGRVPT